MLVDFGVVWVVWLRCWLVGWLVGFGVVLVAVIIVVNSVDFAVSLVRL